MFSTIRLLLFGGFLSLCIFISNDNANYGMYAYHLPHSSAGGGQESDQKKNKPRPTESDGYDLHWNERQTDGTLKKIFDEIPASKMECCQYQLWYEAYFAPYRYKNISLLEIGAHEGHSLAAWAKYFTNAKTITGISKGVKIASNWTCESVGLSTPCAEIEIIEGSQNDPDLLNKLAQDTWEIIIDDGSHIPEHQIRSFIHLFPSLAPNGLYVLEDIETSYWKSPASLYGYIFEGTGVGKSAPNSALALFKDLVDVVNRNYYNYAPSKYILDPSIDFEIAQITFVPNAVLIFKKGADFPKYGRTVWPNYNDGEYKEFVNNTRERIQHLLPQKD